MKRFCQIPLIILSSLLIVPFCIHSQQIVFHRQIPSSFALTGAAIYVDANDFSLVKKAASLLQQDIELVTGKSVPLISSLNKPFKNIIVIGSIEKSTLLKELITKKKLNVTKLKNKWEAFQISSIQHPFKNIENLLVFAGSDRRGTAYGVFELSKQIGVSPWYWWADVPVIKRTELYINPRVTITDAPKVKYRGIFINDEAPCLSNWSKEKFGGFNHKFYEKVFELMLRLKANYLWPAMWGNAFYDDDSLSIKSADEYGIVIGTSHHEPLMRAHDEWRRYGKGKWNYDSNEVRLKEFWKTGMQRATNEKIVSVGMRGDGDEPMSRETATALLERIVKDQREIITEVTGKPVSETPQLWALYKEVQDYYDKGMRVPDDITLLLCDDNWGNIRKLPKPDERPRKGGYGIYYHFDYVGGPRNYKWLNTNSIPRVWEQMHLAYEHNVKNIWIVNVGDIKPMEFPISFFLDYAWNPERIGPDDLQKYTEQWSAQQFGKEYTKEIAVILTAYTKYNSRRKPELLDANSYSFNYNEWTTVVNEYNNILQKAEIVNKQLPAAYKDAYFQLVLHPVKACANLYEMYYNAALNIKAYVNKWKEANEYADNVKGLYKNDSLLTLEYHLLNNGKWNFMMSQNHIGYVSWQEPRQQRMPQVKYVPADSVLTSVAITDTLQTAQYPLNRKYYLFYEKGQYVSIEANHYTKAVNTNGITWTVLPGHGRTGSALTTFPVTATEQTPGLKSPYVEYEFYTYSNGEFTVNAYFSPTLNFQNTAEGLQYAISVDDESPQIISINKDNKANEGGINYKWVADNIIIKQSNHKILKPGKHTLKYWMVNSGVVIQKLVLDFGGVKQSYLGPPETIYKPAKN